MSHGTGYKMIKKTLITLVVFILFWVGSIYFYQDRMIYFPRSYSSSSKWFERVDKVRYRANGVYQTSFIYPRGMVDEPEQIWWLFGGNGSTALDWLSILERGSLSGRQAFVLVDYPGYGLCQGKPEPEAIFSSVEQLHRALSERWEFSPNEVSKRSGTMGHSLGAAIALNTAARFEMPEVVAVSPFTSMDEMAKRKVGVLYHLLKHQYDNREAVGRLMKRENPAKITIFHGNRDSLIPISMGRELAELAGEANASFRMAEGCGHNDILHSVQKDLLTFLYRD